MADTPGARQPDVITAFCEADSSFYDGPLPELIWVDNPDRLRIIGAWFVRHRGHRLRVTFEVVDEPDPA